MGRQCKTKNLKDLHITRLGEGSMKILDKSGKGGGGIYYTVDKDGVYHVVDTRGSKCVEMDFNSAEELIKYYV